MFATLEKQRTIEAYYASNFQKLSIPMHASGVDVYVSRSIKSSYDDLFETINKSFNALYFFKQIASLKNLGKLTSLVSNSTALSRKLQLEGGSVLYSVWHGNIYITKIDVERGPVLRVSAGAGAYRARKLETPRADDPTLKWAVSRGAEVEEADYINTKNLAINGVCENIDEAANYMAAFIQHGFGDAALNKSYSLFFNPCYGSLRGSFRSIRDEAGMAGGTQAAKKLAAVLERVGGEKQEVNLTVHEAGHSLLRNALRDVKQRGQRLDRITVFYANPTSNLQAVDSLRKACHMKLSTKPPLINSLSISQNISSGNIVSGPIVAGRAGANVISDFYDSALFAASTAGLASMGAGYLGVSGWALAAVPIVLGQSRALNKKVITRSGQAATEGAKHYGKKLIWDPVHKMMVKS